MIVITPVFTVTTITARNIMSKATGVRVIAKYTITDKWAVAAVIIIAALRLSCIWLMGLMPQDAYYYFYGQHLALSYFDHPPAIAWILRAFTDMLGRHTWVIKLADTLVTTGTILAFWQLARHFLSRRRAGNALLLLYSTLMITLLSLVSTPDVPMMLFWTLSLTALYRAVFHGKRAAWIWIGIAMGLAFDSKYTALMLPVGTVLFLLLSAKYRHYLWSPWFLLSVSFFFLTISPVIIWNVNNHFASFRFQSSERVSGAELHPLDFFGVLGHQAAILIPVLFSAIVFYLYKNIRRRGIHLPETISAQQLFLLCFFLPLFLGFIIISPVYWVKINWIMPAYITGIIWVSIWITGKWIRWQLIISSVVHLALAVEIFFYPVAIHSDDTMVGWDGLGAVAVALRARYPDDFIFSADDYKTSAMLNFYLGEMVYSRNVIGQNALQFDFIGTELNALKGKNALFINSLIDVEDDKDEQIFIGEVKPWFETVESLPPIVVTLHGHTVRKFLVFRCIGYKPEVRPQELSP
ncbi:MAG TPA: glycosyltransferase family 39 protein [Chitinophaga sp.]|uniref:ArnT family glycosyltransferase n=1 Tax=Chitinophaga sp. TaxID=1869181 RepID=UPI002BFD221F|nr:glycosyltransferase family 39 protein [Chitinophaga sp.]HVI44081.1 glycosyltransferase family 39 protein [Chitinophaga sp.]